MKTIREIKNPRTYITDIEFDNGYIRDITVEHRSNNPKRDFLFVNKKQCKHIPASPSDMILMCKTLAEKVNTGLKKKHNDYDKFNILVVGFAETATAIGTIVGNNIDRASYIMHTTREDVQDSVEVIKFEETHSHATTQKLLMSESGELGDYSLDDFNYILFIEDEISTGNTILNFINAFETQHNLDDKGLKIRDIKYGVASICNWQSDDTKALFELAGIDTFALITGKLKNVASKMFDEEDNIKFVTHEVTNRGALDYQVEPLYEEAGADFFFENRTGHAINRLDKIKFNDIVEDIDDLCMTFHSIRIIGTEEFMEIPIELGKIFEDRGHEVVCHATTRSKIDTLESYFDGEADGIKSRYKVPSAYDDNRDTYIYNMEEHYDLVLVLSDTKDMAQFEKLVKSISQISYKYSDFVIGIVM